MTCAQSGKLLRFQTVLYEHEAIILQNNKKRQELTGKAIEEKARAEERERREYGCEGVGVKRRKEATGRERT